MKTILATILFLLVIAGGIFFFLKYTEEPEVVVNPSGDSSTAFTTDWPEDREPATETPAQEQEKETIIGMSVQNRPITAYHYGTGDTELLFVGGMHGGYSWNTPLVAFELMDYLEENPGSIPENVMVTVIPVLNPDGLYATVGTAGRFSSASVPTEAGATVPGRFNANNVDLNRNFDCEWSANAVWQDKAVSGGSAPFSEPESQAFKSYVEANRPSAVVVWYSAIGGVYASNCHNGILPETTTIMNLYANASGYPAYDVYNYYEITGDAVNWLAKNNIPGISVLLTTHDDTEWAKNRAGVEALLLHYAQ